MEGPKPTVEDLAAHDYKNLIPEFYKKLSALTSNRQLTRVMAALVEYPLENGSPRFSYSQEREAFNVGMKIFDCKYILMKAVFEMKKDEIQTMLKDMEESTKKEEGAV